MRILNRRLLIDDMALNEVTSDRFSKCPGQEAMGRLIRSNLIQPVRLTDSAFQVFLQLTGASPPDDLGDGEAATIAQSFDLGAVPVIDERKATRIALSLKPEQPVLHAIDIRGSSAVMASRGCKNWATSFTEHSSTRECECRPYAGIGYSPSSDRNVLRVAPASGFGRASGHNKWTKKYSESRCLQDPLGRVIS